MGTEGTDTGRLKPANHSGGGQSVPAPAEELTCARDGTPTRLTCVECGVPICPQCYVRTPVGMKCRAHGAAKPTTVAGGRPRWWLAVFPVGLAVVVAALIAPHLSSSAPHKERAVAPFAPNRPAAPYTFGGLGREVVDGDLTFVVKTIDCGATQVVGATTRTAQGKFCALALSIKNVGRSPVTFVARSQTLADANQRRFEVDPDATADHPANAGQDMLTPVINPGNEVSGVLVFDIPLEDRPTTATLHAGPGGFGAMVLLG